MRSIVDHNRFAIEGGAFRSEVIRRHLPLARAIARRFANRGEELEDLVQVGSIGLIAAVDRFRPERGCDFVAYAVPTIAGEIQRHLRDRVPLVRAPRRMLHLRARVAAAQRDLVAELGRTPTSVEIAQAAGATVEEVAEILERAGDAGPDVEQYAEEDPYDRVDERLDVDALLASLDQRRRLILQLYFFAGLSQAEIGERLGISQIHVSRLLRSGLDELAGRLEQER